jgi:hypothetical protein
VKAASHPRLTWALAALGVLTLAGAWRVWLLWGLDLRDLPGPGGVQFLALALDPTPGDPPLPALILRWSIQLTGLEPLVAVRALGVLSSLLGVAGAMATAWALFGRHAAMVTGLLLACWSQHLQQALLLGMDAPAGALAWAGLGLALWGARCRWWGLALALLGGGLLSLGAAIKPTALPVLALLVMMPALSARPWWRPLPALGAAGLGVWAGRALAAPFSTAAPDVQVTVPAVTDLLAGWQRLLAHRQGEPEAALLELLLLGSVAALIPGARWVRRALLLALTALVLGYACHSLGDWLRFRYLVPASLGVFVLAGDAIGRSLRRLPRAKPWSWALPLVVAGFMGLDALAFHQAWSDAREPAVGTSAHRLPAAPTPWTWRYRSLFWDSSLSTTGALPLMELVGDSPPAGVAFIPLQDGRHAHAEAAAAVAGLPSVLLEQGRCCSGDQHAVLCARETLQALDGAGARVVLLPPRADLGRVPKESFAWVQSLQHAARDELEPQGEHWAIVEGEGAAGPLPCQQRHPQPDRP